MLLTGVAGLELWAKQVTSGYPGVNIRDFTSSWRDGLAFCAIIHRFRPDLLDFSVLQAGQTQRNCQIAFSLAEAQLDIPSLLDIRDMTDTRQLDKRSILTYLSQFYHKFSKEPVSRKCSLTPAAYQLSRKEIKSSNSLPPTLNYEPTQPQPDKTNSSEANIAAIKDLVFNTAAQSSPSPTPSSSSSSKIEASTMSSRGSDSGVEQEQSSESSSSRLSSVSPSCTKKTRDSDQQTSPQSGDRIISRKYPANMIIKPKRTNITPVTPTVNNRITPNPSCKYSQGKRNNNKSFQDAFIKFNTLTVQEDGKGKQLKSQGSQTEPQLGNSLVSQHCQTEESQLSSGVRYSRTVNLGATVGQSRYNHYHHQHHHYNRGNNYVVMSGVYSTLV